jgi:CRISPR type IV-associated protein Csf3
MTCLKCGGSNTEERLGDGGEHYGFLCCIDCDIRIRALPDPNKVSLSKAHANDLARGKYGIRKLGYPIDYANWGPDNPEGGWKPYRVTARMAEPVIWTGDGLHLDGILHAAASDLRRCLPAGHKMPMQCNDDWWQDFRLPLAKWAIDAPRETRQHPHIRDETGNLWGWCASAASAEWLKDSQIEIRKKPAMNEMIRYSGDVSINIGAGPLKAYNLTYPTRWAPEIHWYVMGQKRGLEYLLDKITHIGKKHNLGLGRVLEWSVTDTNYDWSIIGEGGRLMRRMPACFDSAKYSEYGAIRAPYWHRSRYVMSIAPEV